MKTSYFDTDFVSKIKLTKLPLIHCFAYIFCPTQLEPTQRPCASLVTKVFTKHTKCQQPNWVLGFARMVHGQLLSHRRAPQLKRKRTLWSRKNIVKRYILSKSFSSKPVGKEVFFWGGGSLSTTVNSFYLPLKLTNTVITYSNYFNWQELSALSGRSRDSERGQKPNVAKRIPRILASSTQIPGSTTAIVHNC